MPEPLLNSDIFIMRDTYGEVNALPSRLNLGSEQLLPTPWDA
jgi:hypothetical protein